MSDLSLSDDRRAGHRSDPRLMPLAVVPALAVTALGAGVAAFLLNVHSTHARWAALIGGGALSLVVLAAAADRGAAAGRVLRRRNARTDQAVRQWTGRVGAVVEDGRKDVRRLSDQVRRGERPDLPEPLPERIITGDAVAELEYGVRLLVQDSHIAVVGTGVRQQVDVFVTIARRLQSLVNRSLEDLDTLEREVEDPDLLDGLFRVDHLSTLLRRHVESLAVLGGATPRRVSRPVAVYTVLRQAISEIEAYARVKVLQPIEGTVHGHAVTDVIHLLAELVENATKFSPPNTEVQVRAQMVAAGLAIDIDDRGLAMDPLLRERLEEMLSRPDLVDLEEQLRDGRIGLFVVARLAQRHGIAVRLRPNVYGGTQAVVVLPHALLDASGEDVDVPRRPDSEPEPVQTNPVAVAEEPPLRVPAQSRAAAPAPAPTVTERADMADSAYYDTAPGAARRDPLPRRRGDEGVPRSAAPSVPAPATSTENTGNPAEGDRPPLPRRNGSYLVPELRERTGGEKPPAAPQADLMARFARGMRRTDGDEQSGNSEPAS